jgi:hypothetical protein
MDIDIVMRQSQLQVGMDERRRTGCMTSKSISMGPEAVGVLVVVLGKEEDFVMPCWTRRR